MEEQLSERIIQIPQAITPAVCQTYIQQGDQVGWGATNIGELNPLYSRSQAVMYIDIAALVAAIQQRAPHTLDGLEIATLAPERTACMRYSQGEFFGLHTDAPYVAPDGALSKLSFILYLNDDYQGGETFFPELGLAVSPEVGKILLFPPDIPHMSNPIMHGAKYIVRSEVLYRPATAP